MMKKDLYFMLKALFVLKIFNFLSRFFGDVGKLLDSLVFMTSQSGKQLQYTY